MTLSALIPSHTLARTIKAGTNLGNHNTRQGHYRRILRSEVPRMDLSNSPRRTAQVMLRGTVSRKIYAAMLRKAFPGDSDNERAMRGAPVLGISVRHFRRLLNCEHDAKVPEVFAVIALIGFEAALSILHRD